MLYQLSYRGVVDTIPTKKRAKLLQFFELTKSFCKKNAFLVFFLIFATSALLRSRVRSHVDALYLLESGMRIYLRGT